MESKSVKGRAARMAALTREEILDAARALFARQGYAATSMGDVASEAGVAVQTIYSRLGSKRGVLLALVDRIDAEAGVADTVPRILAEQDPRSALNQYVGLTRQFQERCGDIVGTLFSAVGAEPDIAAFVAEGRGRHRAGARRMAEHLARLRALHDGVSEAEAAALLTVCTARESWMELTEHFGHRWDDAQRLLVGHLAATLLAD